MSRFKILKIWRWVGETRWCPLPSAIGHAWLVCTSATKPWALPRVKCYQTKSATKPPVTTKTRVLPGQDGSKVAILVAFFLGWNLKKTESWSCKTFDKFHLLALKHRIFFLSKLFLVNVCFMLKANHTVFSPEASKALVAFHGGSTLFC